MAEKSSGMPRCEVHPRFRIEATTVNIEGSNLYYTDLRMTCEECGTPMAFRGPTGLNPSYPTVRHDGSEVTLPAIPIGEELHTSEPLAAFFRTDRKDRYDA